MITRDILNSHSVTTLKKEISKTNVKGYSKMKKAEVVDLMMKNKERFAHIQHKNFVKSEKVQAIAKNFAASVAKGNKVAEKVRKTKDVAPRKLLFDKLEKVDLEGYDGGDRIPGKDPLRALKSRVYVQYLDPLQRQRPDDPAWVYNNKWDFEQGWSAGKAVWIPRGRGRKRRKGILIKGELWGEGGAPYGYNYKLVDLNVRWSHNGYPDRR
jgi:hypothetical protein